MISQTDINKYRQIKAPKELKEKVLSSSKSSQSKKHFFNVKTITSVAACLLVGVFCTFLFNNSTDHVTITPISPANSYPRGIDSVLLVVECDGDFDISTEDSSFYYYPDGSEKAECLTELKSVNNELEIQWKVSESPSYVEINGELYEISFSFSEEKAVVTKIKK